MTSNKQLEMLTVAETASRANVSEFAVRGWVRDKKIHSVQSGRKILISWSSAEKFLTGGSAE
jgi:excisionase family DNA binding protein